MNENCYLDSKPNNCYSYFIKNGAAQIHAIVVKELPS